ncbi:sensor histidine kinase [Anaerosacchariphilus polymeriproducens]|uniref:GHKL domain-containing protein n=1 Tax=Anaerosacchariphilus polymeriproducens TaxID=1812858 RepID=A0A371AZA4_9FIRM|nr:sensor histidine kinase [Anaerosacchariphilus polymeriproducens]RDU24891.1 GHKL domain-containing protein [Anaerosacchariphilus polymeriproducens]
METAIFYFFIILIEAFILWQYTSALFVSLYSKKREIYVLIGMYLLLYLVSFFQISELNTIFFLLVNFTFLITMYQLKWSLALFHSAITTVVMGISELVVLNVISHFVANVTHFRNLIILTVFSKIIYFSILCILYHLFKDRKEYNQQYDISTFPLGLVPMTTLIVMLTIFNICKEYVLSAFHDWMIVISSILLLLVNLLIFGINQYNLNKSREFTQMQLLIQKENNLTEYYKMLLHQTEDQSILIHDIKKHLQSISLLNDKKEHEQITAYIEQLNLSSSLQVSEQLCDNEILNAILYRYQIKCNNEHLTFHTDVRSGTINFISDNDLTSLFCNLLDNAFDAAILIPNSIIELNITQRTKTPFIIITVINSCQKNPFSQNSKKLSTNKSDKLNHGLGMKSIRNIVRKYQGEMQIYYNEDDLTFHTIITLKKKYL